MPPVGKAEEALRRQKEAKQKKLLIFLAPVLLLLLFWQGPGVVKAFTGGSAPAPEAATPATTPNPTATAPDPTSAAPPTTSAASGLPATPVAPGGLPETDDGVSAGPGQLVTFDRFVGKDPFRQQVEIDEGDEGGGGTSARTNPADGGAGSSGSPSGSGGGSGGDPTVPPDDGGGGDGSGGGDGDATAPTTATLDINGFREQVSRKGTFPATDPIFELVSLSARSVKIGLVSGEFSTGAGTITLRRGKPVTLVSEPDGLRYVITLVGVS